MADWRPSNPYLGVSRRMLIPYEQVLWWVCHWEGLPCNGPEPKLTLTELKAINEVWRHEHDCREREVRHQRYMDCVSAWSS